MLKLSKLLLPFLILTYPVEGLAIPSSTFPTMSLGSGSGVLKLTSGVASTSSTTDDLPEGSDLYYTDSRARASISGTAPVSVASGVVSMAASTNSVDGYLTSADHTSFAAKFGSVTYTPSTPSRSLNSNFTPSASAAVDANYGVRISCTLLQSSTVELRSDTAGTPTTVRQSATFGGIASAVDIPFHYLVPPNHNVRLVTSGSCTVSIVSQAEVSIAFAP